jgi:hypothetical protein
MSTAQGRSRIRGQITGLNVIYQRLESKAAVFPAEMQNASREWRGV